MTDSLGFGDPLYDPSDAVVDIVFVHGLGGNRVNTWTSMSNDDNPTSCFWPKDLLPQVCKTARILSFGYNSDFLHFFPRHGPKHNISKETTIDDYSSTLCQNLAVLRDSTQTPANRPIIFVAHSLGGLVIANALSRSQDTEKFNRKLKDNTVGVIFLGTPFEGSKKADWGATGMRYLSWISQTKLVDVQDLAENSLRLIKINDAFLKFVKGRDRDHSKRPVEIVCYFEEHPTYIKGGASIGFVVKKASAAALPGITQLPIAATHSGICKFAGDYVNGYKSVSRQLAQWITALQNPLKKKIGNHSVFMGETYFQGTVSKNNGVMAGNIFSDKEKGVNITGSKNYYRYGKNPQKFPGESDDEES